MSASVRWICTTVGRAIAAFSGFAPFSESDLRLERLYARNEIELSEIRASVLSTVAHARHSGGLPAVSKLLSKYTFRSVK